MFGSTNWMYVFAVIGGVIAVWRIWQNLNKLRQRKNDSWDARLVDQLRKRGSDPFKPHDLDFFLAFPTREAADPVAAQMTTRARRRGAGPTMDGTLADRPSIDDPSAD